MVNTNKTDWDLSHILKDTSEEFLESYRKRVDEKTKEFVEKWKHREDYLHDPKVLKEALDDYENWERNYSTADDEIYYYRLKLSLDQNNPEVKALYNKAYANSTRLWNEVQFFTLRISKINIEEQNKFLSDENLTPYKHFLEKHFKRSKYLLSEPEEKILNLKSKTSLTNWVQMLSGFLSKEEEEVLNQEGKLEKKNFSEIYGLINDKNKSIRDSAAKALNKILTKWEDVAEAEINSVLEHKKTHDELKDFSRPDLGRHLDDDIDTEVVDKLIEAVTGRYDIPHRYYELKSKLFGVEKLEYHERNVEYGQIEKKYSFDEGVNLVYNVFLELDPKFAEILKTFVENGQVDAFPKKGKRSGAFCSYQLITHPIYIFLNHTDNLNDVLTLAHEFGHAINDEFMREKQNSLNYGTPMSTAEVASTFMEDFVLDEILKDADDELKLSILMTKLNDVVSSVFRQIGIYRFEQDLHKSFREKNYLSKEDIGNIFRKNMADYMGDYVEQSEGGQNWWMFISHIRTYFYVYSYASGLLISKSLQNSVKSDHKFIEKVKEFLSAGLSDSPKNIFFELGIDIEDKSFWERGLDEVDKLLGEAEALAKKLKKI